MDIAGKRIRVLGRLAGVTARTTANLMTWRGAKLVRPQSSADLSVVAHSAALGWSEDRQRSLDSSCISELTFRRLVGLLPPAPDESRTFTAAAIANHAGLTVSDVEALALFDVLDGVDGLFGFRDIAVAREARRLLDADIALPLLLYAGSALRVRGIRLNAAAVRETPWGSLASSYGDDLATLDGQLELPLLEPRVRFDEVFEAALDCENEGDLVQAEKLYRSANEIDPRDGYAIFNRGNVLASLDRTHEAEICFQLACVRDRSLAVDCHYNLGILYRRRGDPARAERAYSAALEANPSHLDARHNLALLLGDQERYSEALDIWDGLAAEGVEGARRHATLCRLEIKARAAQIS